LAILSRVVSGDSATIASVVIVSGVTTDRCSSLTLVVFREYVMADAESADPFTYR
jgi:hypothetical protein